MDTTPDVIDFIAARTARDAAIEHVPNHPSMRWICGDAYWVAHRRVEGRTVCGVEGDLMLASRGVPLCDDCYPARVREGTA